MKSLSPESQRGFTLIELLVTMSIVGVLSTTAIITLNPAELIAQSRDSVRIADLSTINSALGIYQTDVTGGTFGDANTVYVSLPDSSADCSNQSPALPALTDPWVYHCVSTSTLRNADGTGWIPVNFSQISFGNPLPSLPIDPTNIAGGCGSYYTYTPTWELTSAMASTKYSTSLGTVHTAGPIQGATPAAVTGRCGEGGGGGGAGPVSTSTSVFDIAWYTPPAIFPADNYSGFGVELYIKDASSTPISGATVVFSADNPAITFGDCILTTTVDGAALCNAVESGDLVPAPGGTDVVFTATVQQGSNPPVTLNLQAANNCFDNSCPIDHITYIAPADAASSILTRSALISDANPDGLLGQHDVPADGYGQVRLHVVVKNAEEVVVPHSYIGCWGNGIPIILGLCENITGPPAQSCQGQGDRTDSGGNVTCFFYATTTITGGWLGMTMPNDTYPTPAEDGGHTALGGWDDFNFTTPVGSPTVNIAFTDTYGQSSDPPWGYLNIVDSDGYYPSDQRFAWAVDPPDCDYVEMHENLDYLSATGTLPFHLTAGCVKDYTLSWIRGNWGTTIATVPFYVTGTVTFDRNGGDIDADPASISGIHRNGTVTLPAEPTWAGHTFGSWNTAPDGSGDTFTGDTPVLANVTVYAQWSP